MHRTLLDISETARYLLISKSTLYRWVHQKKIKYIKIGSRVIFMQSDIEEFINNNRANTE